MKYLSVCSGIEAASVAWAPLGWQPVGFSEIDPFASQVLAHRFGSNMPGERWSHNAPPNYGDMTKFKEWPDAVFDVLVGGTPCQSFSVAGLRQGLADPRGNLMLTYLAILDRYRPEWFLWENVPGVLSSNEGRDFGAFLGGLGQLGYGFAYRVLDAQHIRIDGFGRAVPQRRRRVFVVGHIDWRRAAAVLFDAASLYGDPPPRRQAREGVAQPVAECLRSGGNITGGDMPPGTDADTAATYLVPVAFAQNTRDEVRLFGGDGQIAGALAAEPGMKQTTYVAFVMRGREGGAQLEGPHETANIRAASGGSSRSYVAQGATFAMQAGVTRENPSSGPDGIGVQEGIAYTLEARAEVQAVASSWAVRRLMPIECERLMGFPDNWTQVPVRGKPASDGPRYKTLGNSMAVNVIRWIGHRIEMVRAIPW